MDQSSLLEPLDEDWDRALVVVAHPDDMEYGGAAATARWVQQGKHVVYTLITSGEAGIDGIAPEECAPLREVEQRAACAAVGVTEVEFLGFPDGMLEYGLPLRHAIAASVRRHRPDVVITTNFRETYGGVMLNQADHIAGGRATLDAARDAGNRWIFPELAAEGFEPWGGVRYIFVSGAHQPTHACDIASGLEQGIASLEAQKAYFENLGRPFDADAFLRKQAQAAGGRFGCDVAAAFQVLYV